MPFTIERPDSLGQDQWGVFERLTKRVRSPAVDARYNALDGAKGGKVVSVDVARLLAPEFGSWDGRLRHTPATANPAGAYAHDRMRRELATRRSSAKRLLITAGGGGSGKTSLLSGITRVTDLVFDNQFRNLNRAREILRIALRHKWQVEIVYVHRPFEDVVLAVIERSQRTGRWNRLADLPGAHVEAQRTIVKLWLEFRFRVWVHAVYNAASGRGDRPAGSRVAIRDLHSGGRYHHRNGDELRKTIPSILETAIQRHRVCEEVAQIIGAGLPGWGGS